MTLYFFDLHDGDEQTIDDFGMEFDHFEEARNHAVSFLPDIAREELPNGPRRNFICDIRTEAGQVVYQAILKFRENRFGTDIQLRVPSLPHVHHSDDVTAIGLHTMVHQSVTGLRHENG